MATSSFIYLEDEDTHPEYQYVKTAVNPSRKEYNLHLLPNQYIPQKGNPKKFIKSDESWHVSANKKERNNYAVGSIFKIRGCKLHDNGRKLWVMASDRDFFEPVEFADAIIEITRYAGIITGESTLEPAEEEGKAEESTATPGSILEELEDKHTIPTIEDRGFFVSKYNWKLLIRNAYRRKNTMIIGPSGTGKTEICTELANKFGIPIVTHDMAAAQDPVATLIGTHRMEDGKSIFDLSDFVHDIQQPCFLLLDEINRAPLNANNLLFPLTDKRRVLRMSMADSKLDREIKVHKDLMFLATANIGNEFTGTNTLDAAFVNRFQMIKLGYPPREIEEELLAKRTGIDIEYAKKVVKVANSIRLKKSNEDISMDMSTRQTLEVAELIYDGFTVKEALECYLEPIYNEEWAEIKDILQSI